MEFQEIDPAEYEINGFVDGPKYYIKNTNN